MKATSRTGYESTMLTSPRHNEQVFPRSLSARCERLRSKRRSKQVSTAYILRVLCQSGSPLSVVPEGPLNVLFLPALYQRGGANLLHQCYRFGQPCPFAGSRSSLQWCKLCALPSAELESSLTDYRSWHRILILSSTYVVDYSYTASLFSWESSVVVIGA